MIPSSLRQAQETTHDGGRSTGGARAEGCGRDEAPRVPVPGRSLLTPRDVAERIGVARQRSPLGPQRENLVYFHPSAALARLIDPWRWKATSVKGLACCAAEERVLAHGFAPDRTAVESGCSPWEVLADRAERAHRNDPAGLAPWWIVEGAQVQRLVFEVPLSEAQARFEDLRQQRLLYRLTLDQPDQGDLVRALRGRISPEDAAAMTINLSPWISGANEP